MKDPCVVDASHPVLRLAPLETHDAAAAQGVSWLHDGRLALPNGECLFFLITLWHVCGRRPNIGGIPGGPRTHNLRIGSLLLQPGNLFRVPPPVFNTSTSLTTRHGPSLVSDGMSRYHPTPRCSSSSDPSLNAFLRVQSPHGHQSSHPMHVSESLTSSGDQVRPCDSIMMMLGHPDQLSLTVTRAYDVGYYVQDTGGGGGGGGESILAWLQVLDSDACSPVVLDDDDGGGLGLGKSWLNVEYTNDGSRMIVTDLEVVLRDTSLHGHGHGQSIGVASNSNSPDPFSSCSQGHPPRAPSYSRRRHFWKQPAVLQETHEAHGVGVIIKALVQQNAGALLFLRTMVCVAALLCFAHSILVLGELGPSKFDIGCRKS